MRHDSGITCWPQLQTSGLAPMPTRDKPLAYSPKAFILTKKFHNTDPLAFCIIFTVISNFAVLQAHTYNFPLSDTVLNKAGVNPSRTPYMTLL
jgi:hypothetical protein